jgi:hypothetical protein
MIGYGDSVDDEENGVAKEFLCDKGDDSVGIDSDG